MLTVKTYLAKAGTKGLGLFASEPISVGQIWWRHDLKFNRIFTKRQYNLMSDITKSFLQTYAFQLGDGRWYLCVDNARFVNHSDYPNTKPSIVSKKFTPCDWVGSQNINIGDEITSDYKQLCFTCQNVVGFENQLQVWN